MDDKTFDDPGIAEAWVATIESEAASIRDTDLYPKLRAWLKRVLPESLVEIGSGQGACSGVVEPRCQYLGVDPSPYLVERAKHLYRGEHRRFVVGNVYDLPLDRASFDAAFSVSVWHLLSDIRKASAQVSRILKPSGSLVIVTANPEAASAWKSDETIYLHRREEISEALQSHGLKVVHIETFRPNANAGAPDLYLWVEAQKVLTSQGNFRRK